MADKAPTKLVRDRLGERIPAHELRQAEPGELSGLLRRKLTEECRELEESGYEDIAEFADVIEVLLAIAALAGHSPEQVEAARRAKSISRGAFDQGLVWTLPTP
jgi:predicted house-cleaning noncanonical NTP pyrophosphatase (MazG superfamily)